MEISVVKVGAFRTNCYIISTSQGNAFVVDPGDEGTKIIDRLEKLKVSPQYLLLTHAHHDHIGAIKAIKEKYPQAKVVMGKRDQDMIGNISRNYAGMRGKDFRDFEGLVEDIAVVEGDVITLDEISFQVVETPGHTKGGVTYVADDKMFTGDTLFQNEIGRTDLYGGSFEEICQSIVKLMMFSGEYQVLPGHGRETSLDFERKNNKYVRV